MAGRQRYLTPPEQMISLGREARMEGLTFEEFWMRAVRPGIRPLVRTNVLKWHGYQPEKCVVWPSDGQDSLAWCEATYESKEGWRRAYENLPPKSCEKALSILGPLLEQLGSVEVELLAA